jgi:hypothetical protein
VLDWSSSTACWGLASLELVEGCGEAEDADEVKGRLLVTVVLTLLLV